MRNRRTTKTIYYDCENYNGYTLQVFGKGYIVACDGEEYYFSTKEEAKDFIDTL